MFPLQEIQGQKATGGLIGTHVNLGKVAFNFGTTQRETVLRSLKRLPKTLGTGTLRVNRDAGARFFGQCNPARIDANLRSKAKKPSR